MLHPRCCTSPLLRRTLSDLACIISALQLCSRHSPLHAPPCCPHPFTCTAPLWRCVLPFHALRTLSYSCWFLAVGRKQRCQLNLQAAIQQEIGAESQLSGSHPPQVC